ncbi:hypothetical protein PF005_g32758 [Phytophthora fragariae]|uniref:RxLR effector protein n=1 Tax=Phytophthora fragariae TaxID=53985 RepID=A0A6A3V2T2_9STRA|nr:hypothetical protein PF003_g31940 [Phytophthora fragariae]KAE8917019.1 hypothetical protein PF009_g32660 [Phytophthora fragariae]KAE8954173.1 hypothetical protein PF011_g32184 [Phytophthora fragariae]KAE9054903.1 hypothetical protein PF010_g32342 [Phytophthora fragariae]KAE9055634.1 hypothetical protein PF007_g32252 [Phytophthora fragariae]
MRLYWVIALVTCIVGGASAVVHPGHVGFFASNLRAVNEASANRVLKSGVNEADNNDGERSWFVAVWISSTGRLAHQTRKGKVIRFVG